VASVTAASRNLDVDRADESAFGVVNSLAAYWDTLGWVYFAKGDMANAQRLVSAAWKLSAHAEVGDHLGQIFEKLGDREKAAAAYAAAQASPQAAPEVKEHLTRLVGAASVEKTIAAHRGDTALARTFTLPDKTAARGTADFLVLFGAPGQVESVKFIAGDPALRPLESAVRRFPATGMFPDAGPARILRRGTMVCDGRGPCTIALIVPEDARPVK
jgi:tetratricopeptide (TPR) repeat protein